MKIDGDEVRWKRGTLQTVKDLFLNQPILQNSNLQAVFGQFEL